MADSLERQASRRLFLSPNSKVAGFGTAAFSEYVPVALSGLVSPDSVCLGSRGHRVGSLHHTKLPLHIHQSGMRCLTGLSNGCSKEAMHGGLKGVLDHRDRRGPCIGGPVRVHTSQSLV